MVRKAYEKVVFFPFGRRYKMPCDATLFEIANWVQSPSVLRDRLLSDSYVNDVRHHAVGRVETAMLAAHKVKGVLDKIAVMVQNKEIKVGASLAQSAQNAYQAGLLSHEDSQQVQSFFGLIQEVLTVDEFDK